MIYPNLFKDRYSPIRGKDWIRRLAPEDRAVFVDIGLQALQHGRLGGLALKAKHGNKHLSQIGRIGAIITNSKKAWRKAMQDEMERLGLL